MTDDPSSPDTPTATTGRRIPVLAGPTAVGKTDLAIRLAEQTGAEIISADSRQIYRGLTIGTAKPSAAERVRIAHHFIDELDPDRTFSAGTFARLAWRRIDDIRSRGKHVVVAGGSTLYLEALIHGLADIPEIDPGIRRRLRARLEREGPESLYRELQLGDPATASRLDPTKTSRLLRALEVLHGTGRPLSSYWMESTRPTSAIDVFVLTRERRELYTRIDRRVDQMISAGLVPEVKRLLATSYGAESPVMRTIGYQEIARHVAGAIQQDEAVRLIKRNSRRYAKRQLTWFRRWEHATWISLTSVSLEHAVELVMSHIGAPKTPPACE